MSHSHYAAEHGGGCWDCKHWKGRTAAKRILTVCEKESPRLLVVASPRVGCVFWTAASDEQRRYLAKYRGESADPLDQAPSR